MEERTYQGLSGKELAQVRKGAGLLQTELAELAGIGRHTVSYWENKSRVSRWGAAKMICEALGIKILPDNLPSMRARVGGLRRSQSLRSRGT